MLLPHPNKDPLTTLCCSSKMRIKFHKFIIGNALLPFWQNITFKIKSFTSLCCGGGGACLGFFLIAIPPDDIPSVVGTTGGTTGGGGGSTTGFTTGLIISIPFVGTTVCIIIFGRAVVQMAPCHDPSPEKKPKNLYQLLLN